MGPAAMEDRRLYVAHGPGMGGAQATRRRGHPEAARPRRPSGGTVPGTHPLAALVGAYLPDALEGNGHEVRWMPSGPEPTVAAADIVRDNGPPLVLPSRP